MIEIYRSANPNPSVFDRHNEICRECAKKERSKGFYIEFDIHLERCIEEVNGISFYLDGEEEKEEITCSLCDDYFVTNNLEALGDG